MAVNFVIPLLIPLEEDIINATRLFSENPPTDLQFENRQYCVILSEDAPIGSSVVNVLAKQKDGLTVRYSITGGNRDGLFTIDKWSGAISIAAPLDREIQQEHEALIYEHELVVAAESGGQTSHTLVRVAVADINDNPPEFIDPDATVTIIEEDDRDLPMVLIKAEAIDPDWVDRQGLLYTAEGEGIDGYSPRDAYFSINPQTGELIQLRPLDRDPPNGKSIWKIKVKVHDGQFDWSSLRNSHQGYSVPLRHHGSKGVGRANSEPKTADETGTNSRHSGRRKHRKARHNVKYDFSKLDSFSPNKTDNKNFQIPEIRSIKQNNINDDLIPTTVMLSDYSDEEQTQHETAKRTKRSGWEMKRNKMKNEAYLCLIKKTNPSISAEELDNTLQTKRIYASNNKTVIDFGKLISPKDVVSEIFHLNVSERNVITDKLCFHLLNHSFRKSEKNSESIKNLMNNNEENKDINSDVSKKSDSNYENKLKMTSHYKSISNANFPDCDDIAKPFFCHCDIKKIINCCQRPRNVECDENNYPINELKKISLDIDVLCNIMQASLKDRFFDQQMYLFKNLVTNSLRDADNGSHGISKAFKLLSKESAETNPVFHNINKNNIDNNESSSKSIDLILRNNTKKVAIKSSRENFGNANLKNDNEKISNLEFRNATQTLINKNGTPKFPRSVTLQNLEKSFDLFNDTKNQFELTRNASDKTVRRKAAEVVRWRDQKSLQKTNFNTNINKESRSFSNGDKRKTKVKLNKRKKKVKNSLNLFNQAFNLSNKLEMYSLTNLEAKFRSGNNFFPKGFQEFHLSPDEERSQQRMPDSAIKTLHRNFEFKSLPFERLKSHPLSDLIFLTNSKVNSVPLIVTNDGTHEGRTRDERNKQEIGRNGIYSSANQRSDYNYLKAKHQNNLSKLSRWNSMERNRLKRFKRHEPLTETFVTDKGGCLQFDHFNRNVQSVADISSTSSTSRESFSIHEAQLRHMASQVMKGHGHRRRGNVHVVETMITIIVKDINDNAPVFPNATIFGEVQENGPIDLKVATVAAWDADDDSSGTNARLTYSIEKNVVDEKTGQALFAVHPRTGELRTALCCLDRETTPEYRLQVVASDGGGLKGTGTVVVRLADVNDNSPKLTKNEWNLTIDETLGTETPSNKTILEITVTDPDISNYFFYKVVEASGWGWDLFGIRTVGSVGELYAQKPLDCEDETHRKGFRFLVEVTDKGRGGWGDPRHIDGTWVSIHLRDVNDNPPVFQRKLVRLNVREDIPPGTLITTMKAEDPDLTDKGLVDYRLIDSWSRLKVDSNGGIRVRLPLDREGPEGSTFSVKVIAVDRGVPPLSSTATLSVTLNDVNDCPPRLLPPVVLHVKENTPPQMIGTLFATDDDVWSLGYGPPFNISIAPSNSEDVRRKISLKFKRELDSGRGGAEIWTLVSLDREENRQLTVDITLADAAKLIRTQPIIIIVDDVNDNKMQPGSKTVHLWKTRDSRSEAPLGRVYVDDPDDWDTDDKTFSWDGKPHPLFSLNPDFGTIFASGQIREGRYNLRFTVSDRVWRQRAVKANVSVTVRLLSPEALIHAVPLTLSPTSPAALTKDWSPSTGGGGLGYLTTFIQSILGDVASKVEVVSLYGTNSENDLPSSHSSSFIYSFMDDNDDPYVSDYFALPTACVWISVMDKDQKFINSVKLKGLIQMKLKQLESLTNLRISTEEPFGLTSLSSGSAMSSSYSPTSISSSVPSLFSSPPSLSLPPSAPSPEYHLPSYSLNPSSAASLAPTSLPLQLVDSNTTSLVTPRLLTASQCPASVPPDINVEQCTDISCLNGGRCLPTENERRCICPGNTWGPRCKIRTRSFNGAGWAWLSPIPRCSPLKIGLKILTRRSDGLILYSGPLTSSVMRKSTLRKHQKVTPYIALQIQSGRVVLLVEGREGALKLQVGQIGSVTDGKWHSLGIVLSEKGASLMLDTCAVSASAFSECYSSNLWPLPWKGGRWGDSSPLQIGGLAHNPIHKDEHDWEHQPMSTSFKGCLSELRIAGDEIDLGEIAYNLQSVTGCPSFEKSCGEGPSPCGIRGTCSANDTCACAVGWTAEGCETESTPATLRKGSFAKVALSFIPDPFDTSIQLKFRTRRKNAALLNLSAAQHPVMLNILLNDGVLCFSLSSKSSLTDSEFSKKGVERTTESSEGIVSTQLADNETITPTKDSETPKTDNYFIPESSICVSGVLVSDGSWHLAKGFRRGHNLILEVDDGSLWKRNSTLESLWKWQQEELEEIQKRNLQFAQLKESNINGRVTVVIGGVTSVQDDAPIEDEDQEVMCIDDIRISDHPLPLPPTSNGSRWGQVTIMSGLEGGCLSNSVCEGIVCNLPYVCKDNWLKSSCGCPNNYQLTSQGCQKLDMCLYNPCLNGGSCRPRDDGSFFCECPPKFIGKNCEWTKHEEISHPLAGSIVLLGTIASVLIVALLLLVLFCLVFRYRASAKKRNKKEEYEEDSDKNEKKERWKRAYFTDRSGKMHSDVACQIESSLGIISEMRDNQRGSKKIKNKDIEKICLSKLNTQLSEAELAKLISGGKEHPGGLLALIPPDDLRAYAYEGDQSSAGSLGSAISGLRREFSKELEINPLTPAFMEVIDLLQNLPEAQKSFFGSKTSLPGARLSSNIQSSDSISARRLWTAKDSTSKLSPDKASRTLPKSTKLGKCCCDGSDNSTSQKIKGCICATAIRRSSNPDMRKAFPMDCPCLRDSGLSTSVSSISKNISFNTAKSKVPLSFIPNNSQISTKL